MNEAIDQGVTFIDIADVYGFSHSEELITEMIKERGRIISLLQQKPETISIIANKEDDKGYDTIQQTYTKEYLIYAAEQSLKRLNVEALDVIQLHSPDLEKLEKDEP